MFHFSAGWYIIYTRPKNERKLADSLTAKDITCFLPLIRVVRQWHDRKKVLLVPAFPSYVFVYINKLSEYFDALNTDGSVTYVKVGQKPALVRQEVIDNISAVMNEDDVEILSDDFAVGKHLLITDGALAGLNCEVINRNGRHKLLVRVNLLNRVIIADLPREYFSSCTHA